MSSSLLSRLNDQQRAAVTAPDGPALVIAAAGTGKTLTLTHRVAWLIHERNVRPWNILLLTFTNRAAKEMNERAAQLLCGGIDTIWSGTFHSIANRILRQHANRLGYERNYKILDEADSSAVLKQCIAELGLSGKDRHFPKPDVLYGLFGLAASREADLRETLEEHFRTLADDETDEQDLQDSAPKNQFAPVADIEGMIKVHTLYTRLKREFQSMDFDDLLVNGLRLFHECPDVAERYGHIFRYVLVDEYQDTSRIQSDFVDLLAAHHNNLMAVGDDFQSIYSWRGADISNFLDFRVRHPSARIYKLECNYRSVPPILAVANDVIAGNPEQFSKTLIPYRSGGVKPFLASLPDGHAQARFIVEKIFQVLQSGKVSPGEIAILYRSHFHAMELQLELVRAQIPHTIVSGVRFFEQTHIKDVCALLHLAVNPLDAIAFARWIGLLPRIGAKRAQSMWLELGERLDLRSPTARTTLASLLPAEALRLWLKIETALFPRGDASLLDRPDALLKAFVAAFYGDYIDASFDNPRSRKEDIAELCAFCAKYSDTAMFLDEVTLLTNVDETASADSQESIRLTTVHQAKGLEWKAVFVLWMVQGMFPASRASDEPGKMSEERRLFYVAVTRAKDYLWLCAPQMRRTSGGDLQLCALSPFIEEIDPDKLQKARLVPSLLTVESWDSGSNPTPPTTTIDLIFETKDDAQSRPNVVPPKEVIIPSTVPHIAPSGDTAKAHWLAEAPPGIRYTPADTNVTLDSALAELNGLIGLDSVKAEIEKFAKFIQVANQRREVGLKVPSIAYHMVFTGNPGTGKTTVARIMAKIYRALGVISNGHLVETDRSGLIAQFVGQTAVKTGKVIDFALDGVLFIDEAYSITTGGEQDFGGECISTLLKRMEDDRQRLVVIVAGYPEEMKKFISANPGLESRFTRYIQFPDYSVSELADIFCANARKNDYVLSPEVTRWISAAMEIWTRDRDNKFGNARFVRNLFEQAVERQAMRVHTIQHPTRQDLMTITLSDVGIELQYDDP